MQKNDFTIIVPTLNEEKNLPRLLGDLKKQTFSDFSVIVVDAKSKDSTTQKAKKLGAKVIVSNKKNVSYQRNLGAKNANSRWIVFMDADNRLPKNFLQGVRNYIEEKNPDIVSTWISPDSIIKKDKLTATFMNIVMEINKNSKRPYVLESMIFIKKNLFEKLRGFDSNIPWSEGEDLLIRAGKMGIKLDLIKEPKYTYSFRRLKKIGTFKMLQNIAQIEIIRMVKGELRKEDAGSFYPMDGGSFYRNSEESKITIQKFISILFRDNSVRNKSLDALKKSIDPWKSLFR